jgi:hypothetical protein
MTQYGKPGVMPKFEPVMGIPQDVRELIPLIHIGTDRSLRRQLPSNNYSLLRRMFEDVNANLLDTSNTVQVKDRKTGEDMAVPRIARSTSSSDWRWSFFGLRISRTSRRP